MPTTTPTFDAPLLGQTEKTLNAILDRQLAGTGVTEPQWVTLAVACGEAVDLKRLVGRLAGVFKTGEAEARAHVTALVAAQLLHAADDGSPVKLTDAGQQLQDRIRAAVN